MPGKNPTNTKQKLLKQLSSLAFTLFLLYVLKVLVYYYGKYPVIKMINSENYNFKNTQK